MNTRYLIPLIGLALALPATHVLAQTSGIVGSGHDFTSIQNSAYSWNITSGTNSHTPVGYTTEYTCQVCHTPHSADTTTTVGQNVPLWGHYNSQASYTVFQPLANSEMAALGIATIPQPSGVSKACLSCHDGTIAINQEGATGSSFVGGATSGPVGKAAGGVPSFADFGTNLQGTHPISIPYPTGAASTPFLTATNVALVAPLALKGVWPVPANTQPTIGTLLYNGNVECSSCHDVHNQIGDAPTGQDLLKISLNDVDSTGRGDLLCRNCHIK